MNKNKQQNLIEAVGAALITFAMIDVIILFAGLAQIGIENRSGEWSPFFRWQAEQVIGILK